MSAALQLAPQDTAAFRPDMGWDWNIIARPVLVSDAGKGRERPGLVLEVHERGRVNHLRLTSAMARTMRADLEHGLEAASCGEDWLLVSGIAFTRAECRAIWRVISAGLARLDAETVQ